MVSGGCIGCTGKGVGSNGDRNGSGGCKILVVPGMLVVVTRGDWL